MAEVFALRHRVFVLGQDVPEDLERDELDQVCVHAAAVVDGVVAGTGRLRPDGIIGRMAVAEHRRGQGIGAAVLALLEQVAVERGIAQVELHAQLHAAGFYDRAGYTRFGDVYPEAGIEHVSMRKALRLPPG